MKVLHVTEAMGAGVLTLLESISRRQTEESARVEIWFIPRSETPPDEILRNFFHGNVALRRLEKSKSKLHQYLNFAITIRRVAKSGEFDVIHLHSSIAGAIGRFAVIGMRQCPAVFYSPHGFAFLRLDTSLLVRKITRQVEKSLVDVGAGIILASSSEHSLALRELSPRRSFVMRTGIHPSSIRDLNREREPGDTTRRPTVGMVGRVTYQKAPWRFSYVSDCLANEADFLWIGGGSLELTKKWLSGRRIEVTGWLDLANLEAQMDRIDILLFPTLWEGMSISLIQAQARGIPAVVSDAVGNIDSVLDGKSGYICRTDEEMVSQVRILVRDQALRNRMSQAAVAWAKESLTDEFLGTDSLRIYRQA